MSLTIDANGVTLGGEHFGEAAAPLILLAGGPTMLSWPDALCEALARGGRHVVRYDLRDSGASTTVDPEAPRIRRSGARRSPLKRFVTPVTPEVAVRTQSLPLSRRMSRRFAVITT
jgi:pimeloyl-ACP methyl ester carboxylesterase